MLQNIKDRQAVDAGLIFSLVVCVAIVLLGTSLLRFDVVEEPPNNELFYEWQLVTPNVWAQVTAWLGFVVHQFLIWGTIWYAQKHYTKKDYTDTLRPVNKWALGINVVFIILHYLQTAVFYDAIAQDLPSWTAQFAVALMLIVILGMENQRRGLFFGKKVPFRKAFTDGLRRYHGYFFSFAVIYTFWFHPMVPTFGHLVGFVHVILVMFQGSLMFMRYHLNVRWMLLLEILVLPHAFQVALEQGPDIWPMFLFGFATIFLVTQMHGLRLKAWVQALFYGGFTITVLYVYFVMREPYQINEVIRIPLIEYLVLFIMYWIYLGGAWLASKFGGTTQPPTPEPLGAGD